MLVLVGKTCTGKSTIRDLLVNRYNMEPVITHTTRPPRDGEENYIDYIFVNDNHFHILKEEGCNVASGDTWYYASSKSDYDNSEDKVVILNPEGLKQIRKLKYPIFAVELTAPDLVERLKKRGDNPKEAERRIHADNEDFKDIDKYLDCKLINYGNPQKTAERVYQLYQYWLGRRQDVDP